MFSLIRANYSVALPRRLAVNMSTKIDKSNLPVLKDDDIEEKFISGSGPGGQCVNKSVNCCQLRHKPTGIVVKSHQSRSLETNRKMAREILIHKLDNLFNGENSVENQLKRIADRRIAEKESLAQKKRLMKKRYKEEILNSDSNNDE